MTYGCDPRPYLLGGDPHDVRVPARVAAWLSRWTNIDARRGEQRGRDGEVDAVLLALRVAALNHGGADSGTRPAPAPEPVTSWLTTAQAAARLGIGERAVRQLITRGRLPATRVGGRWLIHPTDLALTDRRGD